MILEIIDAEMFGRTTWMIIALLSLPIALVLTMFIGGTYGGEKKYLDMLRIIAALVIFLVGIFAFCYSFYALSVLPESPGLEEFFFPPHR